MGIKAHFNQPKILNIVAFLPTSINQVENNDKDFQIFEWMEYHDSRLFLPIILNENGEKVLCKKCFCEYCKMWINSKFKSYFLNQHLQSHNHLNNIELRNYQQDANKSAVNSIVTKINLILHILLEGKPISNIESPFFQIICPELPNRHTLTRAVLQMIEPFKKVIIDQLKNTQNLYLCVDEWTDKLKRSFLGVTAQGVCANDVKKSVIFFQQINPAKVDGAFLQETIFNLIHDFGIEQNFNGIISDNAGNMISAFDNEVFHRKCCLAHTLNLIIKDIHLLFKDKMDILDQVRMKTKNSSIFSKICQTLNCPISKLPSYSETRWYSLYNLIHNFNISIDCIKYLYSEKNCQIPFSDDDVQFFQEFEIFLKYIKEAIELFESEKFGQISKAFFELHSMKDSVMRFVENSLFLHQKAEDIKSSIESRIQMIYSSWGNVIYAAALLNPDPMYSEYLTEEQRNLGKEYIELFMEENNANVESVKTAETSSQRDYIYNHEINMNCQRNELETFLSFKSLKNCSLIDYWNENKTLFPFLSKVVFKILSAPTSSASIERSFSLAKELLGNKQLRMNKELVESRMLFIGNKELFEHFFKEIFTFIFAH